MTAADGEKESMDTTLVCFRGYADCVEGAIEKGIIYGTSVYHAGVIKNTKCMQEAYEMGENVQPERCSNFRVYKRLVYKKLGLTAHYNGCIILLRKAKASFM